jgi:hypothetical protein
MHSENISFWSKRTFTVQCPEKEKHEKLFYTENILLTPLTSTRHSSKLVLIHNRTDL